MANTIETSTLLLGRLTEHAVSVLQQAPHVRNGFSEITPEFLTFGTGILR
jgi:hypothetical protein